ncbi:ImuA family protein [Mucilaginibacter celer]|uniref:Error-prone repair protein ImuA n=1 Tax=Mucilaginibacter celer TaxID=2305508 RepID=A0A494VX55_9SPHI|nr:Error-prone repair protein ImuA [Mucilaginibacter celer]AYL95572.1 Error-prone repair protein ImuA [Mucilaginibacter celer]
MPDTRQNIISKLQQDILLWEGFRPPLSGTAETFGLGPVEAAFPNGVFPTGAIHELLTRDIGQAAASGGFIAGLLSVLMQHGGACIWIGMAQTMFPPALKTFGVEPHRVIFVNLLHEKDVLWAMEEALKCSGLAAVIAEVRSIDFKQSRRLQLAVEQSRVTGFILRDAEQLSNTACTARWHITPLPSQPVDGLPGLGHPRWQVNLLKVRNGKPGSWVMEWVNEQFITHAPTQQQEALTQAG